MAGKYGSSSITVAYDDGQGGTARTVTGHILTMGGMKITSNMEASHAFGDAWEEHLPTGVRRWEPITLEGHWDTTATTGPHVVFIDPDDDPNGGTRTLTVGFGDSKSAAGETYLMSYEVLGQVGNLTRFRAEIQPTGALTWS